MKNEEEMETLEKRDIATSKMSGKNIAGKVQKGERR